MNDVELLLGEAVAVGPWRLRAVHSSKCADVLQSSTADGANVQQWTCGGGLNQQWRFNDLGDGYYEVVSVNSGKCLDVHGAGTADGTNVQQWSCRRSYQQQWKLISVGTGVYNLRPRHSGKCLDVKGLSLADGANIHQWSCRTGQTNQHWRLEAAGGCTPESTGAFCARLGKNCGTVTAPDNCGVSRSVGCGSCTSPQTCGGGGTPNVCGGGECTPESTGAFCARLGKNCGTVTAPDNCGASRSVACGSCTSPQTCGGGGTPNVCGGAMAGCKRTVRVASVPQLQSASSGAAPGDCIVVASGSYTTSGPITVNKMGTATDRITIAAETVGGVTISGTAGFVLASPAAHVTVRGFRFVHAGQMTVAAGTANNLVTRNYFQIPTDGRYLNVAGNDNEVSFNRFANKTTVGSFIKLDEDNITLRPYVHHNHFINHTYAGSNGGEALQIFAKLPRVEHNLFEEIHVSGESISVKEGGSSAGGFYRFNTLRNTTRGHMTLRFTRNDVIEGNFFIKTPGLRVYGRDHKIRNNYFDGGSLILGDGTTTNTYPVMENVEVAFNTLVNARITGQDRGDIGVAPANLRIANNIIQVETGSAVSEPHPFVNVRYEGNILWGAAAPGAIPSSGFRRVDPKLVTDTWGRYHLGSTSPAINSAIGTNVITDDIDGQSRSAPDVGADEVSTAPVLRRPLTANDVGPSAP